MFHQHYPLRTVNSCVYNSSYDTFHFLFTFPILKSGMISIRGSKWMQHCVSVGQHCTEAKFYHRATHPISFSNLAMPKQYIVDLKSSRLYCDHLQCVCSSVDHRLTNSLVMDFVSVQLLNVDQAHIEELVQQPESQKR